MEGGIRLSGITRVAKDRSKGKADKVQAEAEEEDRDPAAEGEGTEGEGEAKRKLPLKLLLIAGAATFVILGGGAGAAFVMMAPKHGAQAHRLPKIKRQASKGGKADRNAPQVQDGPDGVVFYTLPAMVVNMQSPDGKPTFLKLKLAFELPDHETADELDPEMPRLNDMFQTFLRELRPEDLSGSEGTYELRLELQRRVDLLIAPAKVNSVLIEEMLIN